MSRPTLITRIPLIVLAVGISLLLAGAARSFPILEATDVVDGDAHEDTTIITNASEVGRGALGFAGRTLWDMLVVFGVPVVVAGVSGMFAVLVVRAARRTEHERALEADRARATSLREYLGFMTSLVLEGKLRGRWTSRDVKALALARTFGALRGLDGVRKGILLLFLYESQLITSGREVISLDSAELRDVDLTEANLGSVHLAGSFLDRAEFESSDLQAANFDGASLVKALLIEADLGRARFADAILTRARLDNADLTAAIFSYAALDHASLREAILIDTDLKHANLSGADLSGADLTGADLTSCDLRRAVLRDAAVTNRQLQTAESLVGARMPDGTKMTARRWEEFQKTRFDELDTES